MKYQIIYADPPWRYEHPPIGSKGRAIENHYPTMLVEDIKRLPIKDLGEDNSVLFLWATAPKLKECLEVMTEWGYQYRTCVVWDKEVIGMGYWFRNQHEILLIGLRGKFSPPIPQMRERSVYREKRGKHSKKPDYFRNWINKCFPVSTKIELFARKPQDMFNESFKGWDVWGNEVESNITIGGEKMKRVKYKSDVEIYYDCGCSESRLEAPEYWEKKCPIHKEQRENANEKTTRI